MKPATLSSLLSEAGRCHNSIGIRKLQDKTRFGPASRRKACLVLDCPSPLPSTFNTPLSVAPWSAVWPCSYVTRTCATPTPAYSYLLLLFLIYGRHSPFKAVPLRFVWVDQGQPPHYFSIRTKYPLPSPRARAPSQLKAVVTKQVIYFLRKAPYVLRLSLLGYYPFHTRFCCPPILHFFQPHDWCLMKASEVGEGAT